MQNTLEKIYCSLVSSNKPLLIITWYRHTFMLAFHKQCICLKPTWISWLPMQHYTGMETYTKKSTDSQVCNNWTYRWNSVSEALSDDVSLSIYFHFKVWIHFRIIWLKCSELCYLLCLSTWENLFNIFTVQYHKDLLIYFLV